ncbi:MAG: hypothetical protein A2X23_05555 [Chloroflexi bacterium GWC2_73_18]|nr:MAG: hypothetical protein A2X23_05555 [Chloroflexi bacterium GWC2_73_18]
MSAAAPDPGLLARDDAAWDAFVAAAPGGSYLQTTAWAEVKRPNGWTALRIATAGPAGAVVGAQVLVRRVRGLPWAFGYAPRGPVVSGDLDRVALSAFTGALRERARGARVGHVRIDPEIEADERLAGEFATAGWRPAPAIQPEVTRVIDLGRSEAELWSDLRPKWRQYVNGARRAGVRPVEGSGERLDEFYRLYAATARRAGFLSRSEGAQRLLWEAFAGRGMARLLFAETAGGEAVATLLLLACGRRITEVYGGMSEAGAVSRANYLLKWEAIRRAREAGFGSYDLWGMVTPGIAHFKTGFGGREVRYVGARDLVIDPLGRAAFETGVRLRAAWERRRHGARGVRDAAGGGGEAGA